MAIFDHVGSITPEPIELKFGKIDYVRHPTTCAKIGGRPKRGMALAIGEVVISRFLLLNRMHAHLTLRRLA